jgi:hypothetical protein
MLVEALRFALPLLAMLLAGLALAVALRLQRRHRRLARALAREWGLRTGDGRRGGADEAAAQRLGERDAAELERALEQTQLELRGLVRRLSDLEARPRSAAPRSTAGEALGVPERVREHLEALGLEDVTLVTGESASGMVHYEAREAGMPRKGSARVGEDGRVVLAPRAAHRAFP